MDYCLYQPNVHRNSGFSLFPEGTPRSALTSNREQILSCEQTIVVMTSLHQSKQSLVEIIL